MPQELEVRDLRMVDAIARHGTMTEAATQLHVSQSALSHQLAELERSFGVRLFDRQPRRMPLTSAGTELLGAARAVLERLRSAESALRRGSDEDEGELRISTECYTCYHWLPACLKKLQETYPGVEVRIVVEATHKPMEALLAGKIDLAIMANPKPARGTVVRPLFRDELVLIVSPEHPLAKRSYARASDFVGQNLISYSVPERDLSVFTEVLNPVGVRPARVTRVEITEAVIEMVKANMGIAVLARWAVAPYLDPARLKAVRLTKHGVMREWCAVARSRKQRPKFIDALVEIVSREKAFG